MRWILPVILSLFAFRVSAQNADSAFIRSIYDEVLTKGECYENLRTLCKTAANRLSGSPQAEKAVQWGKQVMEDTGFDKVWLQEVMVPHWVRSDVEYAKIISPEKELKICALGGSIGTGESGITAEVIEVQSLEEVAELPEEKVKGKIVFYNRPMNPKHTTTFWAYAGAVDQRGMGAIEAAKKGAIAVLVRSMNLRLDDYPHTGAMRYDDAVKKIPAAAVSTNDAEYLSDFLKKQGKASVQLKLNCETLPDVLSHNVIGEIKGSEFPEQIIVVGGHLDAWDKGEGAHDDGSGCVQSIEVLRILKALGYQPKRTIRAVLFMNEENGLRGGKKYAEEAKKKNEFHLAAIESDAGGFTPRGFSIDATDYKVNQILAWKDVLAPYGLREFPVGYSGADIGPLKDSTITLIGYRPDSQRYFDFHHADTDVFEAINKRELELGAASMTALVYLIDKYGIK
ncbi:MAG: peptidase M28 family protein [Flavobacteriales bacterium]|nr:MAG: peptidase M28 family protein [Flavobacteriales bacterium]